MAIFIEGAICPDGQELIKGEKTTSLVNVIGQVKAQNTDGELTVYINSPGGIFEEGFAIHDYLTSLGRPIKTIAITQCASMATVVFLAGVTRIAKCPLMIHNPWSTIEGDSEAMSIISEFLSNAEKQMEKFYSEKLQIDANTISNLMQSETYIDPEQAVALGFATSLDEICITPVLALISKTNKPINNKKMSKTLFERVKLAAKILTSATLNLDLTTADGSTLTVDREDGDPQVGDSASPDGEHVMPDGSTIIVTDGVISEIVEAESEPTTEEQLEEANARIANLEDHISKNSLSQEDKKALEAVKAMGGIKALATICSNYKPQLRENKTEIAQRVPDYKKQLNNLKKR